jgi:glucan phosphoethanolaminetransferase (alkaline phosphatase superfamily)
VKSFLKEFLKKTKRISTILFVFFLYDVFVIKSPTNFFSNIFGTRYFVNYVSSMFTLLFFILILDNLFKRRLLSKFLAGILLIIPLGIQTAHYSFYNMPLNAYGIRFFLHEPKMTTQLGLENINVLKILAYCLFSVFILYLFLNDQTKIKRHNLKLGIYTFLYIPLIILCGVNWYLILDYQNPLTSVYAAVPEVARSFYFKQLKANKPEMILNPNKQILPNIVWIIGESVTKNHMSLYGYKRKTTPNIDSLKEQGKLVPFQNVVSIGPHTIISVPYMMVGMQNIDPQGEIYSKPNIFEYAKARGYETAFISSQDLRWRNFDQLVGGNGVVDYFRSGPDFSPNVSVAKGADDLKVLNSSILPHLKQMRPPFLLVAHMDGSHYPYNLHSEPQYKKFLPEDNPNSVNAYDNTLVYSDLYLSKLIEEVHKKDPNAWIFYTTDHGQPVQMPQEFAPDETAQHLSYEETSDTNSTEIKAQTEEIKQIQPTSSSKENKLNSHEKEIIDHSLFSDWRKKIEEMFAQKQGEKKEETIIFNQGYDKDIIHNAFFIVPPKEYLVNISSKILLPVAQSDIFATILDLMNIQKPLAHIDGFSLLKDIPKNRLRVSTGFVTTNDNVPEAQVTYPDYSSVFVDFSRDSVSLKDGKTVIPLEKAPISIRSIFPKYQ